MELFVTITIITQLAMIIILMIDARVRSELERESYLDSLPVDTRKL